MIILNTEGTLTESDSKTNIIHRFTVPENTTALLIDFAYSPKTVENRAEAEEQIRACLKKYGERLSGSTANMLPVKNLVTLSLDGNGEYRGAAHRQLEKQHHIISASSASPGFIKGETGAGEWDIVLNAHYIGCEVKYTVAVRAAIAEKGGDE